MGPGFFTFDVHRAPPPPRICSFPSTRLKFKRCGRLGAELSDFMSPCRQTVVLMESSHESCSAEEAGGEQGLQAWVDEVNSQCCLQHGIDVCRDGSEVPWTCNAVCATAFIPFAEQCLGFGEGGSPPPPSPQVAAFRTLCE